MHFVFERKTKKNLKGDKYHNLWDTLFWFYTMSQGMTTCRSIRTNWATRKPPSVTGGGSAGGGGGGKELDYDEVGAAECQCHL